MNKAAADVYLDVFRPNKEGKCSVKIKITHNRKRKYIATGIHLEPDYYYKTMQQTEKGKRIHKTIEQKNTYEKIIFYLDKANKVINNLTFFTFDNFENVYFEQRNVYNSVSFAFDKYIEELKSEGRISTAESYNNAKRSLENYKRNLTFADINNSMLKKYENWMLENNKSKTTVGIYTRSLRTIYNLQNIDKTLYPFGEGKNKYSIPTGANTKKALTVEELKNIYHHQAPENSTKQMAKDYWIFLYLCNGMNVKDFCLLKWKDINENILTYERAKTKRSKKLIKSIAVALKPETWDIIKKWGQPSISKDNYIFPHITPDMKADRQQAAIKQLTKTINKYMKQIAQELDINKNITTYFARHSFATVLKRSGATVEFISEMLGHNSVLTTESYLDSFENEHIQETTNVLNAGFSKAN
jgi:integrase/recombinase XerD